MFTMGESGKALSSSSVMTCPTSWNGLTTGATGEDGEDGLRRGGFCFVTDGAGGNRLWAGCSGSTLNLTMLLLASTGGKSCHFSPST